MKATVRHPAPHPSDSREKLYIALVVALLLHVAAMAVVSWFAIFDIPKPEERHEVTLVPPPPPPPPPEEAPKIEQPPSAPAPKARLRKASSEPKHLPPPDIEPPALAESPPLTAPPKEPLVGPPKLTAQDLALDFQRYERVFGEESERERAEYVDASHSRRRAAGFDFGKVGAKVRGSLGQKRGFVQPGNQEPLGERKKTAHDYLYMTHELIHTLFADGFLEGLTSLDPRDPLNNLDLVATTEFEILENGDISEVRLIRPSGNTVFDAAAVDSLYRASPYPPPPPQILSWNRRFYVRWGFYRNHRKCGMFNAEPFILRAPDARPEPLPRDKLIIDG